MQRKLVRETDYTLPTLFVKKRYETEHAASDALQDDVGSGHSLVWAIEITVLAGRVVGGMRW